MSNLNTQSWLINRRHALKGLGTFIAPPLLDCMTPLRAAEPIMPRRSAFIYLPNGVNTLDYQIIADGADYEFSRSLSTEASSPPSAASTTRVDWDITTTARKSG